MSIFFLFCEIYFFECSRGKADQAAGEPVFCVINSAVFLWKILELISMAKRQNFSMQPGPLSHSAFKKHLLWIKKYHPRALCIIFSTPPPREWRFIPYMHPPKIFMKSENMKILCTRAETGTKKLLNVFADLHKKNPRIFACENRRILTQKREAFFLSPLTRKCIKFSHPHLHQHFK